ncbi:leucyl aminopeptidase, partial [cyanobacterium TDX16]
MTFAESAPEAGGTLVLPLGAAGDLATRGAGLDEATRQGVERAAASAEFGYRARQTMTLRGIGAWDRILLVGLGAAPDAGEAQWSGAVAGRALMSDDGPITVLAGGLPAETVAGFATGMGIGHYRSDLYRSTREATATGGTVTFVSDAAGAARSAFEGRGAALVEAMTWTRDIA